MLRIRRTGELNGLEASSAYGKNEPIVRFRLESGRPAESRKTASDPCQPMDGQSESVIGRSAPVAPHCAHSVAHPTVAIHPGVP